MYLNMAFTLQSQYEKLGDDLIGKNILMASYGSGNTMAIISGTISKHAPSVIAGWNLNSLVDDVLDATYEQYEQWVHGPYEPTGLNMSPDRDESIKPYFALESIREDGYREYTVRKQIDATKKSETPVHLFRSA
jgi:hydroxymethylglutaryl-CoA synthase